MGNMSASEEWSPDCVSSVRKYVVARTGGRLEITCDDAEVCALSPTAAAGWYVVFAVIPAFLLGEMGGWPTRSRRSIVVNRPENYTGCPTLFRVLCEKGG
jgi:hypothetical protein